MKCLGLDFVCPLLTVITHQSIIRIAGNLVDVMKIAWGYF